MLIKNNVVTFDRTGLTPLDNVNPYPTQLGTAVKLWVEADYGVTLNGTAPTAWADQSSYGTSITSTGSPEPLTYQADMQHGLPGIYNNTGVVGASGEAFLLGPAVSGAAAVQPYDFDYNTPFSVVLGLKVGAAFASGTAANQYLFGNWTNGNTVGWGVDTNHINSGTGKLAFFITSIAGGNITIALTKADYQLAAGQTATLVFTYDGSGTGATGLKAYVNGQLVGVTGSGTISSTLFNAATRKLNMFAGATLNAPDTLHVGGVISGALTASQVKLMDAYINGKWVFHS